MKKFTLNFVSFLVIMKFVLCSIFIYQANLVPLSLERTAIASEPPKEARAKGKNDKYMGKDEKIDMDFLLKRNAKLKQKEEALEKKKAELMVIQEEINRIKDIKDEYDNMSEEEKRKHTRSAENLLKELGDDKPDEPEK